MAERKKCARCGKRWRSSGAYCKVCHRAKRRERLAKDPSAGARAQAKYQKTAKGRAATRRYEDSEKGREARQLEAKSGRKGIYQRRYAIKRVRLTQRERAELTAYLPVEVVQPFVVQMLVAYQQPPSSPAYRNDSDPWEGVSALAENVHVGPKKLKEILEERDPRVHYLIVDRLATHGMFSLDEMYDRAREWALLTGSDWPDGYFRNEGGTPEPPKPRGLHIRTRELVSIIADNQPLTRQELAEKANKRYRTVEERVAWLHKRGMLRIVDSQKAPGNKLVAEFVLSDLGQKIADTLASEISTR